METTEWKTSCRIGKKGENAAKILMEQFNVPYQDKSKDKVFQRMDVDFLLTHPNHEWQFLEAKARARDYGDIGLELVTNDAKNTIGWAYNSKCHLLTYYIDSSRKMYVCDGPRQREWLNNIDTTRRRTTKAPNYSNGVLYSHSIMLPVSLSEAKEAGWLLSIWHLNDDNRAFTQTA